MLKAIVNSPIKSGDQTIVNGNLVISTSGKGVDFSATPSGTGTATSELLSDYEEGGFTPSDASGASLVFVAATGRYTKIGRLVTIHLQVQYPTTANASAAKIGGLPYPAATAPVAQGGGWGFTNGSGAAQSLILATETALSIYNSSGSAVLNSGMSDTFNYASFSYITD